MRLIVIARVVVELSGILLFETGVFFVVVGVVNCSARIVLFVKSLCVAHNSIVVKWFLYYYNTPERGFVYRHRVYLHMPTLATLCSSEAS